MGRIFNFPEMEKSIGLTIFEILQHKGKNNSVRLQTDVVTYSRQTLFKENN